jgi:hypothetical protein
MIGSAFATEGFFWVGLTGRVELPKVHLGPVVTILALRLVQAMGTDVFRLWGPEVSPLGLVAMALVRVDVVPPTDELDSFGLHLCSHAAQVFIEKVVVWKSQRITMKSQAGTHTCKKWLLWRRRALPVTGRVLRKRRCR